MKRLLCIVSGMNTGGAETFLMKLFRTLDRSKYMMDFCVSEAEKGFYEDEIVSLGGRVFRTPPKSKDISAFRRELSGIIRNEGYEYVLRIASNAFGFMDLRIAQKAGARICSARSSNSSDGESFKAKAAHIAGKLLYTKYVDVKIAPSDLAAEYTFGKGAVKRGDVLILHNGIDLDRFSYDPVGREQIRTQLGVPSDALLIGHIGRFNKQKNHGYLIKVFSEVVKKRPDAMLLLVGEGELMEEVRKASSEAGIEDKVVFAGVRSDVPQLLSAMDVLALPSLYEGMPNVVIEAQAVGVPCVISDTITREANVTGNVKYLSIDLPPEDWADALIEKKQIVRGDAASIMKSRGYSIFDVRDEFTRAVFGEDERN